MRKITKVASAVILVAIAVGAYWWVTSNKELMWALTRGSVDKTSSSTASYEVALRTASKRNIAFEEGTPPKEWILRLPRNYVTVEQGTNGVVHVANDDGNTYFSVGFDTSVDPDTQLFSPSAGKSRDQLVSKSMVFGLRNDEANNLIAENDLCVPNSREKDILGPLGYTGARNSPCSESIPRCPIRMHMNGWYVRLSVSKDLYSNPDNACALARKFLNQYTVKRDELR
jgi:hypothetical protein